MPDTIRSRLFWLFMFLRMGSVEARPGRNPAWPEKIFDFPPVAVPSPSEARPPYSDVVITGGSSGIGKSFIELGESLKPDLIFCNLSRRPPADKKSTNFGNNLNHFSCDL